MNEVPMPMATRADRRGSRALSRARRKAKNSTRRASTAADDEVGGTPALVFCGLDGRATELHVERAALGCLGCVDERLGFGVRDGLGVGVELDGGQADGAVFGDQPRVVGRGDGR